ncbi:hypothetical protein [Actinotalea sp. JY-7876]|uniref:hypothetical protein n=1 Tax=Actinotalea sp. JY-7876 TaxID=2758442 RepID=UPI0015F732EA|nr:hypothetical protein [Actinotalea sp. JY-7876]
MTSPPDARVRPPERPAAPEQPRQPAGAPPPGRVPPRPPDPEAARAASRRVTHFGLLLLATLVVTSLPLPWQAAAVGFAVAAVVVGIRALMAVWRAGLRGAVVPLLGLGIGFSAVMVLSLGTMLALWPLQVELEQCRRDALTISAQDRCQAEYEQSLRDVLERAATP